MVRVEKDGAGNGLVDVEGSDGWVSRILIPLPLSSGYLSHPQQLPSQPSECLSPRSASREGELVNRLREDTLAVTTTRMWLYNGGEQCVE